MKNKKGLLSLLLGGIMLFSCVGCADEGNTSSGDQPNHSDSSIGDTVEVDTNKYLVQNNATNYVVVIPEKADSYERLAAQEFVDFFEEATDVKLSVETDTNKRFNGNSKYFSIGKTGLLKQAGLSIKDDFMDDGVTIRTVENSVFLCGGASTGTLYAVYDYLGVLFDYEYYGSGCYSLNRNVSNVNFYSIDYVYEPSFEYRVACDIWQSNDGANLYRTRCSEFQSGLISVQSSKVHNCFLYVEDEIADHADYWYSTGGGNLCFTARGNAEEYEALVNAVATTVKGILEYDHTNKYMLISLMDCVAACGCNKCKEMKAIYGTDGAAMLLLCNDVRAKIDEWFAGDGEEYARDDFYFGMLAYMDVEHAPVQYNEATGKYEGINGIKCADGVCVMYAPIYHDYLRPLDAFVNSATVKNFQGWSALTDTLLLWGYDKNFQGYYTIYDTLGNMQEFARFAKQCGVDYYFLQGNTYWTEKTEADWGYLHQYIYSKLAWNTEYNVPELIKKFFENFYGPAADRMYNIYTQQTVHVSYLKETQLSYGGSFSCETAQMKDEWWPKQLVQGWENSFKQAFADIEFLKETDGELWQIYYDRICAEELSPLFLLLSFYQGELNAEDIEEYKTRFKENSQRLGVQGDKGRALTDTWSSLGISY